jgi:hypothetical protein
VELDKVANLYWFRDDLDDGKMGLTDPSLKGFADFLWEEMERAIAKHGVLQTPVNPKMFDEAKLVILVEELGEVARAMTYDEGDRDQLKKELLQVSAMAGMWYMSMMEGVA